MNKNSDTEYNKAIEKRAILSKERIYLKTQTKINEATLRFRLRVWKYIAVASTVLLLIIGGAMIFNTVNNSTPILVESTSQAGSITRFTLSDGTVVALNASSSISYPLIFNGKTREVRLNGEAYFEVVKETERPFIVETNHMKINVLGTHFNVKSYEDDEKVTTTLLEGSVSIEVNDVNSSKKRPVLLVPGQQIILDRKTRHTVVSKVNPELYSSWKDGQCFFENEKFIDIVKILERQFGVTIRITSPTLESLVYSGFFGKKEGVLQILNSFKKYRNFDFRQDDNSIEIYEK